jgi:hypothetical protein
MYAAYTKYHSYLLANRLYSLKRLNPKIWLPTITLLWGIASVGQGLITNEAGLFGIRIRWYCFVSVPAYHSLKHSDFSPWYYRSWPLSWCHVCLLRILSQVRLS